MAARLEMLRRSGVAVRAALRGVRLGVLEQHVSATSTLLGSCRASVGHEPLGLGARARQRGEGQIPGVVALHERAFELLHRVQRGVRRRSRSPSSPGTFAAAARADSEQPNPVFHLALLEHELDVRALGLEVREHHVLERVHAARRARDLVCEPPHRQSSAATSSNRSSTVSKRSATVSIRAVVAARL